MAISDERLNDLAAQLAERLRAGESGKPQLRLIVPAKARDPHALDESTRQRHERRIRFICGRYGIWWLIDQALDGATDLESMPDPALLGLLADCEKALRCMQENVSFEDAGLVRSYG